MQNWNIDKKKRKSVFYGCIDRDAEIIRWKYTNPSGII